jgi:peptidoglycan/LPS O-acetylase OafA/YrhL
LPTFTVAAIRPICYARPARQCSSFEQNCTGARSASVQLLPSGQPVAMSPSRQAYYPYFDYLRAAAAIGVFMSHADQRAYLPEQSGNACVQVFFALSGFLIGGILLRSHPKDLPLFYFNRATRIWIPYAIAIALLALVTALKQGFSDPKFGEFFFYMITFVYNWFGPPQLAAAQHHMPLDGTGNQFWSICVEEQFYLFAPLLIIFLNRFALLACLAGAALISPGYFASISAGVFLALTERKVLVIVATALVGAGAAIAGSYLIAAPLLSVALVGTLAIQGRRTSFGAVVGGASYSFYLNHWLGLFLINLIVKYGAPYPIAWLAGLVFAAAVGITHYVVIDRQIAQHRADWFSIRLGIAAFAAAVGLVATGFLGAASIYH